MLEPAARQIKNLTIPRCSQNPHPRRPAKDPRDFVRSQMLGVGWSQLCFRLLVFQLLAQHDREALLRHLRYGSEIVNVVADARLAHGPGLCTFP